MALSINEWCWAIPILLDEDDGVIADQDRISASEMLDKACFVMEIDAGYCHVILERCAKRTGLEPMLRKRNLLTVREERAA